MRNKYLYIPSTAKGKTWKLTSSKSRPSGLVEGVAYEGTESTTDGVPFFSFKVGVVGVGGRVWSKVINTKRLTPKAHDRALKAVHDELLANGLIKEAVL